MLNEREEDKGGYKVHPVPDPLSINVDNKRVNKDAGKNQNLKLFKRGKIMSIEPGCVLRIIKTLALYIFYWGCGLE
jgi:hypothetical protein